MSPWLTDSFRLGNWMGKEETGFLCPLGFPGGSVSKESACSAGDLGLIPGLGRAPGEGNGNPLQYSCLENPHGLRSLVGRSPGDLRESGTTEHSTYILCPQEC